MRPLPKFIELYLWMAILMPAVAAAPTRRAIVQPFRVLELGVVIETGEVQAGQVLTGCVPAESLERFRDHRDFFIYLECDNGIELKIDDVVFDSNDKQPIRVMRLVNKK